MRSMKKSLSRATISYHLGRYDREIIIGLDRMIDMDIMIGTFTMIVINIILM